MKITQSRDGCAPPSERETNPMRIACIKLAFFIYANKLTQLLEREREKIIKLCSKSRNGHEQKIQIIGSAFNRL